MKFAGTQLLELMGINLGWARGRQTMYRAQLSEEQHMTEKGGEKHLCSSSPGELGVCMGQ